MSLAFFPPFFPLNGLGEKISLRKNTLENPDSKFEMKLESVNSQYSRNK